MNSPQLPAHLLRFAQQRTRSVADDVASGIGSASPPYISIEGGRFTLVDADGNKENVGDYDKELGVFVDVIIIDTNKNVSRIYYKDAYNSQQTAFVPPDCWSDNGIAPSRACSLPQAATCASCPMAEWGSKVNPQTGKGVPACGSYKKVAVIHPASGKMLFLMRIPPASLKNVKAYVDQVTAQVVNGVRLDVSDIVTRIHFEQDKTGVLNFIPISYISDQQVEWREQAYEAKITDALVGRNDVPIGEDRRAQIAGSRANAPATGQPAQLPSAQPPAPAASGTAAPLSQRAMDARPPQGGNAPPPPRGRGTRTVTKPKTEAPAPKAQLEAPDTRELRGDGIPAFLDRRGQNGPQEPEQRDTAAEAAAEQAEAQESFGVAENAGEPPRDLEGAMNELFGRK
jgi:hypothetical protein